MSRSLVVSLVFLPALAVSAQLQADAGALPLEVWWGRNRALLSAEAPETGASRAGFPLLALHGERRRLLDLLAQQTEEAEQAALAIGRAADGRDLFTLLEAVKRGGRVAEAAALGLGLQRPASGVGPLAGLAEDGPVGRQLAGDLERAVPESLRVAAALGLGLSGDLWAYRSLRDLIERARVPESVQAAALIGLSFSEDPDDVPTLRRPLERAGGSALVREAAAVALGRHGDIDAATKTLLATLIQADPMGAGRGAAVALWYAPTDGMAAASLRRAARSDSDSVTRVLSLVSLAAQGDASVRDAVEESLGGRADERGFAVVALALLGRARPDLRDACRSRTADFSTTDPHAHDIAQRLFDTDTRLTRPNRGRTMAHLAGGNAAFRGSSTLGRMLDLAARGNH